MTNRRKGWGLASLGMLLVSTDTLFIRLSRAGAWEIVFIVALAGLPIFGALAVTQDARATPEQLRRHAAPLMAVACLGTVTQIAFITAVTRTAVANVVTIVASAPIMAAVVGLLLFGQKTSRRIWIAIAFTIIGIGIVVAGSLGAPTLDGDLLALLAIAGFGTSITIWRQWPDMSVYAGLALGSLGTAIVAAWFVDLGQLDARAWLSILGMGLVFNPAGRIAHATAPRFAPASEVALFTPVETIAAPIWAWLAFSERPPGQTIVGALIIVTAVIWGTFGGGAT